MREDSESIVGQRSHFTFLEFLFRFLFSDKVWSQSCSRLHVDDAPVVEICFSLVGMSLVSYCYLCFLFEGCPPICQGFFWVVPSFSSPLFVP
ncbi:hypothetical protein Sjap_022545 [Stephania japonica]|uniref:Uncharacterized protein n=1 Tax=Stephania japonica TaxID=461633 RepID=A0AAP0HPZ1_9MAGN